MTMNHQSHKGELPGQTDSSRKLARLKLPSSLLGKRVLDIGCNEGFFCNAAAELGAKEVIGIDVNEEYLAEAHRRYSNETIQFRKQSWSSLPQSRFDIILWTSAMHYELDPSYILRGISGILEPGGLFILECGVAQTSRLEMFYSLRHDGGLWYPTQLFLENALTEAGFSFRIVSEPEITGSDPVPRAVFHAELRRPTVLIIYGDTKKGKTNAAHLLRSSATKVVSLDHFVSRIANAKWSYSPLDRKIKEVFDPQNLGKLYRSIDDSNLTESYVSLLARAVASTDKVVIFDGFMTDRQVAGLESRLVQRCNVWRMQRAS